MFVDDNKEEIRKLLEEKPLYSSIPLPYNFYFPDALTDLTINFYCEADKGIKTFSLKPFPNDALRNNGGKNNFGLGIITDHNGFLTFTQHYRGECNFCKKQTIELVINFFTKKPFDLKMFSNLMGYSNSLPINPKPKYDESNTIYLRKIGQFPPFSIKPETEVYNYLNEEDKDNFKKALINLSQSYGIGAFAYMRRIVENELKRIVEDLAKLDIPDSPKIKALIDKYESDHQMSNLINGIFPFLPGSFKALGNNPLGLLYGQLSGGIHSFQEDECLQKATDIKIVLQFVIKRLNEEKSEILAVRQSLKNLSTSSKKDDL